MGIVDEVISRQTIEGLAASVAVAHARAATNA
jgi:hypothetical protein